ncbi:MAG: hypothetical protein GX444_03285 [Myxococcales bacterium]|nr:hypothetical protein [Myxococcales bacterium]
MKGRRFACFICLLVFVAVIFTACGGGKKTKHQATEAQLACSNYYDISDYKPCMDYDKFKYYGCDENLEQWRKDCVEDCIAALYSELGTKAGCSGSDTCVDTCMATDAPDCFWGYYYGPFEECALTYSEYAIWVCYPGLPKKVQECTQACFADETNNCDSLLECVDACYL